MTGVSQKTKIALLLTQIQLVILIGFICAWLLVISPPTTANPITIVLINVLPFVLFLPGVLTGKQRSCVWLCFVVLVYFCGAVLWALTPVQMIFGLVQSFLLLSIFFTSMMYVRWYGKDLKAQMGIETKQ